MTSLVSATPTNSPRASLESEGNDASNTLNCPDGTWSMLTNDWEDAAAPASTKYTWHFRDCLLRGLDLGCSSGALVQGSFGTERILALSSSDT